MEFQIALRDTRIVPVIAIEEISQSIPLARALVAGGLPILEITLRTACALEAMERISKEVENAIVGAGTVINSAQVAASRQTGAKFIVSPGIVDDVVIAAQAAAIPLLPGVATASDIMRGLSHGLSLFKLFPAENVGGTGLLKALSSPFPQVRFCPTGGVNLANMSSYLEMPNVIAVGGSWMVPAEALREGEFARITGLAREAHDRAMRGRTIRGKKEGKS